MYAIHPAVVHFPIALLLLNLALTLAWLRRPDAFLERAAYGSLVLGWWATLAAVLTGTAATALVWPLSDETLPWVNAHAAAALALLVVYGRVLLIRRRDPDVLAGAQRRTYLALIVLGAFLVALDGWLGGHLVYRLRVGVS